MTIVNAILEKFGATGWVADLLGVAIIVVGVILGASILSVVFSLILRKLTSRSKTSLDDDIALAVRGALLKLVFLGGFWVMAEYLEARYEWFTSGLAEIVSGIVYAIGVVVVTLMSIVIVGILTDWYSRAIASKTKTTFDDELMPLIRRIARLAFGIVGAMMILQRFDVDIKGLIAVLGVGSLAVALAAKDTLSNMIAGFVIMVDRPFRQGDRVILSGGVKCDVYQIGMRSTKFLTFENTIIIVPNSELVNMTIDNHSYPDNVIRVVVDAGVAYGTDIDQVENILLELAQKHEKVLKDPPPKVQFLEMGDSSLNFRLVCRVQEFRDQWQTRLDLRSAIYKRFMKDGIEIPFPQRVVHLKKEEA
ncbi:MAG: mechanosensitive ion channel [candidate division Zixibacteria bacterium]|nr:mechanosensitive ion channel [candidate division Zixibacteria bacterium]